MKIGDKVVYVDNSCTQGRAWHGDIPVNGTVYVISGFGSSVHDGSLTFHLVGMCNQSQHPALFVLGDLGYRASRLRPLEELKEEARRLKSKNLTTTAKLTKGKE